MLKYAKSVTSQCLLLEKVNQVYSCQDDLDSNTYLLRDKEDEIL